MIRFFIRLTALAIVASLPIPLQAQKPEATEKISKSFKVGPSGAIDINNVSGTVVVNPGGADVIVVDALKRVRGNVADAKDQLARTTVEIAERAGRVEVRTVYTGQNLKVSVDYTVTAPAGTTVSARTMSGDIMVTGIKGEVRADTMSGRRDADRYARRLARQDDVGRRDGHRRVHAERTAGGEPERRRGHPLGACARG